MINQNKYIGGQFTDGELYKKWPVVNKKMIDRIGGKMIWALPLLDQILVNGHHPLLDDILAYWYPSHQAFLDMTGSPDRAENFKIREKLIDFTVIHRTKGENPPQITATSGLRAAPRPPSSAAMAIAPQGASSNRHCRMMATVDRGHEVSR
ncbi:MAG: hypothetical protein VW057_14035 [Rhodospirillaceae bacterium]